MKSAASLTVPALFLALGLAPPTAFAQDVARGAALYRVLPGEPAEGSCISCHGEPVNNRNSVLRGAAGADLISKTVAAVSRMGYLRQYLSDADLADISAYLATIVPAGPVETLPDPWPTADDFGAQQIGTQSSPRVVLIRNLQPRTEIPIGTVLSSDPVAFPVLHDCPVSLPPLGQCRLTTWFRPQGEGPAGARFSVVDTSGRALREGTLAGSGVTASPPVLAWAAGTPSRVDFGQVPIGQAAQRVLTLVNASPQAVALGVLRITGANAARFTLDAPCAVAGRLEAGAACAVVLGFAPEVAGGVEGWVELISDATNAPLVRVAAAGIAASAPPPPAVEPGGSGGGAVSAAWSALLLAAVALLRLLQRR